jgi:hypothetical protein
VLRWIWTAVFVGSAGALLVVLVVGHRRP